MAPTGWVTHGEDKEDAGQVPSVDRGAQALPTFRCPQQMVRELGLNPKEFGGLANTCPEPWKLPLPAFIAELYFERFKKGRPDNVRSIEQMVSDFNTKKAERRARKRAQRLCNHLVRIYPHHRSFDLFVARPAPLSTDSLLWSPTPQSPAISMASLPWKWPDREPGTRRAGRPFKSTRSL